MDSKEIIKMWSLRIMLAALVLSFFSAQSSFASETSEIKLNGDWDNEKRSIALTIPITATTDGHNIYIESTKPDRDITITISNCTTGKIVYKQTISEASTTYIVTSIEDFPAGEYQLELTSPYGDILKGYFIKQ